MSCKWERTDCRNLDVKCHLCATQDYHYDPVKKKTYKKSRPKPSTNRKGGQFEARNHEKNEHILEARSEMTPASGAGSIKGDEQISGIISVMEELKTRSRTLSRGNKSFSVQKDWLEKLEKEAEAAHKEFYYLKFAFGENEKKTYVILDEDMVMSMIKTMAEDRKLKYKIQQEKEVAEKRARAAEAKNIALEAELEYYKVKEKLYDTDTKSNDGQ